MIEGLRPRRACSIPPRYPTSSAVIDSPYSRRNSIDGIGHDRHDPADLAAHTIIQPSGPLERIPQATTLRRWAARAATISCSTMPGCAALARAGAGTACLPRHLAEAIPGLRRVLAGKADWTSPLWMLSRRELVRTARVRALMDQLGESYRDARL
jgi:DNA-binding transcriptional LysR family regulator